MELDLELAKKNGGEYIHTNCILKLDSNFVKDFGIETISDCNLDVHYKYSNGKVIVKGQGSVYLTGNCFRCGERIKKLHTFEFDEFFLPANSDALDEDAYTYSGVCFDLTKMVEDNLFTSLPNQFLCKDDCKGLCPQCFANLNMQNCNCKPIINNAFAKLIDLNFEEGK